MAASSAGKGDGVRPFDPKVFRENHAFIWGKSDSYKRGQCGEDCAQRGAGRGKCWGQVVEVNDYASNPGDCASHACQGHLEYTDSLFIDAARAYIPEP